MKKNIYFINLLIPIFLMGCSTQVANQNVKINIDDELINKIKPDTPKIIQDTLKIEGNKIAIFPFDIPDNIPELSQFGTGMVDSIVNAFVNIPDLIIIDRSLLISAISEENIDQSKVINNEDSIKVSRKLGVGTIILGSIQKENENFRINARLIDTQSGKILSPIQLTGTSVFELQDLLSEKIIEFSKLNLSKEQISTIEKATKPTDNQKAFNLYNQGRNFFLLGTEEGYKKSIEFFDKAFIEDSNYSYAIASKSEAQSLLSFYLQQSNSRYKELLIEAENNANKALEIDNKNSIVYRALSLINSLKGDFENGKIKAEKAIEINPEDAEAYFLLWANTSKDPQNSNIKKALQINPYLVLAHYQIGVNYQKEKNYDKAIEKFNTVLKINPSHINSLDNLGIIYLMKNEIEKSLEIYKDTIKLNPNIANLHFNLGNVYSTKKEFELAIEEYNKAIELNPNFDNAYSNLGNAYYSIGNTEMAINSLEKAIEINSEHINSYYNLGLIYKQNNQNELAKVNLSKACELGLTSACNI